MGITKDESDPPLSNHDDHHESDPNLPYHDGHRESDPPVPYHYDNYGVILLSLTMMTIMGVILMSLTIMITIE